MFILLIALFTLSPIQSIAAADDVSQLTSHVMQLNCADTDQSPEGYMHRLREAEKLNDKPIKEQKFKLRGKYKDKIQARMQTDGYGEYYDYFIALAASNLTDEQKVEKRFVMIPYFRKLQQQPFEVKKATYKTCNQSVRDPNYAMGRLLFAAFFYIATINKIHKTLLYDDVPLLKINLDNGSDPNVKRLGFGGTFHSCKSLHAAQLLLQYGANFQHQHQQEDLINHLCCITGADHDTKLLPLFLSYVTLDATNQFGQKWIKQLSNYADHLTYLTFSQSLSVLLHHGCYYDDKYQKTIINERNLVPAAYWKLSELEETKREEKRKKRVCEINELFQQDKKRRKNIVVGLRNRAITGKPLAQNTNLSACYARTLEMNKDKGKDEGNPDLLADYFGLTTDYYSGVGI